MTVIRVLFLCSFGHGWINTSLLWNTRCLTVAVVVEAASNRLGYVMATSSSPSVSMTQTKTPVHKQAKGKKITYYTL